VKLGAARIGFAGYSRDFGATGDRRRFAAYARLKGIPLEYAELNRPYDLVYATCSSDLAGWTRRKRREGGRMKLVFELIDSYLTQTNPLRRLAKLPTSSSARPRSSARRSAATIPTSSSVSIISETIFPRRRPIIRVAKSCSSFGRASRRRFRICGCCAEC
jgi:hypothetical protein